MQLRLHPMLRRAAVLAAAALAVTTSDAQDLLASQAPIDHKMRSIDSLSIQRLIEREEQQMPAFDLYNEWSHEHVHQYGDVAIPGDFRIDLRGFAMPTSSRQVTSEYGYRRSFRRMHYGIDVKVYTGDTIVAAFPGKVRIAQYDRRGYGKYVVIRHPNGLETVYGHLSAHIVSEAQVVKAGEPIGLGGNTGHSFGSHLHFETRLLGDPINPALMFDFENQDVLGDYYVYRGSRQGYCVNDANGNTRNELARRGDKDVWVQTPEMAAAAARAAAKREESRRFQQERASQQRSAKVYKVRSGDNLGKIARANGTTIEKICHLNRIKETTVLQIGQILKVR